MRAVSPELSQPSSEMIWRGSERVGCALYPAGAWDYLICRYSPPGNVVGQKLP